MSKLVKIKRKATSEISDRHDSLRESSSRTVVVIESTDVQKIKECETFIEATSDELDTAFFLMTGGTAEELKDYVEAISKSD